MTTEKQIPGFIAKRELLEGRQRSPEALSTQGREFLARGLFEDALTFFSRAGDRQGMEEVMQESRRQGDAFSFEAALRLLDREAGREEWREIGDRALEGGRLWFAYQAYEKADDQAGLEKTRQAMTEQGITVPG